VALDPLADGLGLGLPCQVHDPDLWFAEAPAVIEFANRAHRVCGRRDRRTAKDPQQFRQLRKEYGNAQI
jgi:hypothetical protein